MLICSNRVKPMGNNMPPQSPVARQNSLPIEIPNALI
jgi:hypothetical protein